MTKMTGTCARGRSKLQPPSAAKLVRTMARARIGTVPALTLVPDKRRRPPKHKKPPVDE